MKSSRQNKNDKYHQETEKMETSNNRDEEQENESESEVAKSSRRSGSKHKKKLERQPSKSSKSKNAAASYANNQSSSSSPNSSVTPKRAANNIAAKQSVSDEQFGKKLQALLKLGFGYTIQDIDFLFIENQMDDLISLDEIWERIGFNKETKQERLSIFFDRIQDTSKGLVCNEEELEQNILASIDNCKLQIKEMCNQLHLKYDELIKPLITKKNLSMLEEEELLRSENKKLQEKKKKRMDQLKVFTKTEAELCEKLVLKKTHITSVVPTEQELQSLEKRIKELEQLLKQRMATMNGLKEEIMQLAQDLETSRQDSFAEIILYESVDAMTLGELDIEKAIEYRDALHRKDQEIVKEIETLRVKILELWKKLEIDNFNLKSLITDSVENMIKSNSKITLVVELRKEYERCVQIKCENMQKFIEKTRHEIREICEGMYYGPEELNELDDELFRHNVYTEELLTAHEEKLSDLNFRLDEQRELFEKTAQWIKMWDEFVAFVETTKDPNRLKQRGYNTLTEEKKRKGFEKNLPKLELEIKQLAEQFEHIDRKHYTIYGMNYEDYISAIKDEHEENKRREKDEKKIMRDTVKINESRYGCKPPTTPANLKKRKALGCPYDKDVEQVSKKKNLESTMFDQTAANTPGLSRTRVPAAATSHLKTPGKTVGATKKVLLAKRKSRTPNAANSKRLLRKSRSKLVEKELMAPPNDATITSTSKSSNYYDQSSNSTLKSSSYNTTQNSTASCSSNSRLLKHQSTQMAALKYPPQAASAKFSTNYNSKLPAVTASALTSLQLPASRAGSGLSRQLTSTAHNSFVENETFESIEHVIPIEDKSNHKETLNLKAVTAGLMSTSSLSTTATNYGMNKFTFKYSKENKIDCEVNYSEFISNVMPKKNMFTSTSNIQEKTNINQTKSSSGKLTASTRSQGLLTSTLINK